MVLADPSPCRVTQDVVCSVRGFCLSGGDIKEILALARFFVARYNPLGMGRLVNRGRLKAGLRLPRLFLSTVFMVGVRL